MAKDQRGRLPVGIAFVPCSPLWPTGAGLSGGVFCWSRLYRNGPGSLDTQCQCANGLPGESGFAPRGRSSALRYAVPGLGRSGTPVPVNVSFGTVVAERLFDLLMLVLLLGATFILEFDRFSQFFMEFLGGKLPKGSSGSGF